MWRRRPLQPVAQRHFQARAPDLAAGLRQRQLLLHVLRRRPADRALRRGEPELLDGPAGQHAGALQRGLRGHHRPRPARDAGRGRLAGRAGRAEQRLLPVRGRQEARPHPAEAGQGQHRRRPGGQQAPHDARQLRRRRLLPVPGRRARGGRLPHLERHERLRPAQPLQAGAGRGQAHLERLPGERAAPHAAGAQRRGPHLGGPQGALRVPGRLLRPHGQRHLAPRGAHAHHQLALAGDTAPQRRLQQHSRAAGARFRTRRSKVPPPCGRVRCGDERQRAAVPAELRADAGVEGRRQQQHQGV
mmetsp:Transcript_77112/g.239600  ORF Transcript_77112/g.239600 Transcript_77112/m.239600 type:complete len:302 (-) Transcript_77112:80-985(-)